MDNNQMQYNQSNDYQTANYQSNNYQSYNNGQPSIPEDYKPISAWGYVGYELLFCIPCIGFILMLVFALGGSRNVNLKNFARSYLCMLLIVVIVTVIISLLGGAGMLAALSQYSAQ